MRHEVPYSLLVKGFLISTPVGSLLTRLRKAFRFLRQLRHPELFEIYLEESRTEAFLVRSLKEDSVCIDVGAHIGSFLSLLRLYAPNGHHIAFEPSREKSALLRRRFPTVKIYDCALSDIEGFVTFAESLSQPGYSRVQPVTAGDRSLTHYAVETRRLDDVLGQTIEHVHFIKLDIEGGELAALRGAENTVRRFKPLILFECGSEYELSLDRQGLYTLLVEKFGYSIFTLADYLFDKGPLSFEEFRKCGLYPFRAFNFVAKPRNQSPSLPVQDSI